MLGLAKAFWMRFYGPTPDSVQFQFFVPLIRIFWKLKNLFSKVPMMKTKHFAQKNLVKDRSKQNH